MAVLATFTIPLVTLPAAAQTFGPFTVPTGVTGARLTLNRTAGAASLQSQPGTMRADMMVAQSDDGGTTWYDIFGATIGGGDIGQPTSFVQSQVRGDSANANRRVRATVTPSLAVSVSGTLELTG